MSGEVTYTVKELVERLDAKVDLVIEKLDTKAEEATVDALEQRVLRLEMERRDRGVRWTFAQKMFATIGAIFTFVSPIALAIYLKS